MKKVDQIGKPRRFVKRNHDRNPTFHSQLVLGIIQYDPVPENSSHYNTANQKEILFNKNRQDIIKNYLDNKRSSSTSKIEFDSLQRAQQDFTKRKLRNPFNFTEQIVKDSRDSIQEVMQRPKSTSFKDSSINYKSSMQIKSKLQYHGYDIINHL